MLPALAKGQGPIALLHVSTRELAQNTHVTTSMFCHRTTDTEDAIGANVVRGSVSMNLQGPKSEDPDFGRRSEVLVAKPGKVMPSKRARRFAYAGPGDDATAFLQRVHLHG